MIVLMTEIMATARSTVFVGTDKSNVSDLIARLFYYYKKMDPNDLYHTLVSK
jgi:hypothetical protein